MGFKRSEGIVKSYNINGKQEEHDCYILEIGETSDAYAGNG